MFDSLASLQAALQEHGQAFAQDVPNFTNMQPQFQILHMVPNVPLPTRTDPRRQPWLGQLRGSALTCLAFPAVRDTEDDL